MMGARRSAGLPLPQQPLAGDRRQVVSGGDERLGEQHAVDHALVDRHLHLVRGVDHHVGLNLELAGDVPRRHVNGHGRPPLDRDDATAAPHGCFRETRRRSVGAENILPPDDRDAPGCSLASTVSDHPGDEEHAMGAVVMAGRRRARGDRAPRPGAAREAVVDVGAAGGDHLVPALLSGQRLALIIIGRVLRAGLRRRLSWSTGRCLPAPATESEVDGSGAGTVRADTSFFAGIISAAQGASIRCPLRASGSVVSSTKNCRRRGPRQRLLPSSGSGQPPILRDSSCWATGPPEAIAELGAAAFGNVGHLDAGAAAGAMRRPRVDGGRRKSLNEGCVRGWVWNGPP